MSTPTFEGTTPLVSDRYIVTMTAAAALAVGDPVEVTADWTVNKVATQNSMKFFGICLTAASAAGKKVSVVCRGICRAKAYGAIAAGDQITTSPYGTLMTDNTSKDSTIRGVALTSCADGNMFYLQLW